MTPTQNLPLDTQPPPTSCTDRQPAATPATTDRPAGFELLHSATDLERTACARYYAFWHRGPDLGYPREPRGPALLLGSELHKISEEYLSHGVQPDRLTQAGAMFIEGLPYLPPPGSGGVEAEKVLAVSGFQYFAAIDYMGPLPKLDGIWTLDHKTSKSPERYGLQGEYTVNAGSRHSERKGFLDNVQAVLYAAAQLLETGASYAQLRWLYYKSVGAPMALPRDIRLSRTQVEDAFGALVHPLAERATVLRADNSHPLALEPNPKRCHAYNKPCHYTEICNLSLSERLNPKPKQEVIPIMSLLAKAEARGALQQAANTQAAPANGAGLLAKSAARAAEVAPAAAAPEPEVAKARPATIAPPPPARDMNLVAIVCEHLGTALKAIAADLRK
jgi:hypothetical protein